MTDRFEICVGFVLEHETEYNADGSVRVERDPDDPGGTTKFGIDQRSHPNVDVAKLTLSQAKEIYRSGEWCRMGCDHMKQPWDLAVLDAAVNIGMARTAKLVQRAVNAVVDGFMGPLTIAAVNRSNIDQLGEFLDLRDAYYRSLPLTLRSKFLKGWLARVADVRAAARVGDSETLKAETLKC
jgi:lysozyme family protein